MFGGRRGPTPADEDGRVAVQPVGAHRRGVMGTHRRAGRNWRDRWLLVTIVALATVAALAAAVALVAVQLTPADEAQPRRDHAAGGGGVPQGAPASSSGIRIHSTG